MMKQTAVVQDAGVRLENTRKKETVFHGEGDYSISFQIWGDGVICGVAGGGNPF